MPPSIGVNLRVTGHCSQGGRKYMEDMFSVAYQQTEDEKDLEYAFFGIFDGHGGREAATFAKEHLLDYITNQKGFWSDRDDDILRAIREGFLQTHDAMWGQLESWPKTASGLPSTSGTTASIAFIRKGKIYIGHVGDSSIVLGYQEENGKLWKGRPLTTDHKPESKEEIHRIEKSGGKVIAKSGVPRVVWNRPRLGHKGPVRRSTHIDEIPFLAVARSLGDLWSYNPALNSFVVSPEPDIDVVAIDIRWHRCLIFGTDGLWNVLSPNIAVSIVQAAEIHNEKHVLQQNSTHAQMWMNPSKSLVDRALDRWSATRLRADNTSVVTLMLDPPGPPRAQVLLSQKQQQQQRKECPVAALPLQTPRPSAAPEPTGGVLLHSTSTDSGFPSSIDSYDPTGGVAIFTRFPPQDPGLTPSPDSSSSHGSGRVCKVGDVLHRERSGPGVLVASVSKVAASPSASVQINEVSSSNLEENTSCKGSAQSPLTALVRQKSFLFPGNMIGYKRRHSSIAKLLEVDGHGDIVSNYEPCQKRRTRSEDKRLSAPRTDDELNTSDTENERIAWPAKWGENISDLKLGHHERRNKAPMSKVLCQATAAGSRVNALRPPGYMVTKLAHRRSILNERESTRMLRSDTAAATPIRTLRSRNVDMSCVSSPKRTHKSVKELHPQHRQPCWSSRAMTTRSRVQRITK